jgi:hypothetical protein
MAICAKVMALYVLLGFFADLDRSTVLGDHVTAVYTTLE